MADTIYCLDITEERLVSVLVEKHSSTRVTVVKECTVVDIGDNSFADALAEMKERSSFLGEGCLVTLGCELFAFRNLSLPFTDRKKIDQVLPFELEELSLVDVGNLVIDSLVTNNNEQGADIIAAMISKEKLSAILSSLIDEGFDPSIIGINGFNLASKIADSTDQNFVLLNLETYWTSLFVVTGGQVVLVRSLISPLGTGTVSSNVARFVQTVKQTLLASTILDFSEPNYKVVLTGTDSLKKVVKLLLSASLGGVDVEEYYVSAQPLIKISPDCGAGYRPECMDKVLASGMKGSKKRGDFNFRKGDLRKSRSTQENLKQLFTYTVPLGVVLVACLIYLGYGYSTMVTTRDLLKQEIDTVFRETLPEVKRIVNPIQQLQVVNKEISATYRPGGEAGTEFTVLDLLAELSSRIPASYKVKIVRLVADMDTVRVKAITGDFNTVDNIQKEIEKSPRFENVTISSANQSSKGDGVGFELKLELAPH